MVKNTIRLLILIFIVFVWLPTGAPDDFIIIPIIINAIGFNMYVILSIIFVVILYNMLEGKTLADKLRIVTKELQVFIGGIK